MSEPTKEQQLQAEIEKDKTARANKCLSQIKVALEEHKCTIIPIHVFEGNQCVSDVKIQAL
jgi:ribosomal protein L18E